MRLPDLWAALCVCALVNLVTQNVVVGAEVPRAKRVLMLSTGSRFSVAFPILEQNAVEKLRQLYPGELDFHSEYLDIIRFPSEKHHRIFRAYLHDKFAHDLPHLVILFYAGNLGIGQKVLAELFPRTPVVAVGVTDEDLPVGPLGARATGIAQRSDPDGTIKLIHRLHPGAKRIVVIGGTTEIDRAVISRVMQAARPFADKIQFELWDNRPMAGILKAVTSLPPDTVILFSRMFRDGAGEAIISAAAGQAIAKASNVPVYGVTDAIFGTGAVGGSLNDIAPLGQRAGALAHRVLSGTEPASIPLEILSQGTPIFDWRALQRWNIGEQGLPAGSVVRYRPNTFWDQYKWLIIAVLSICLIEAALIQILLRERRKRRLAQTSLEQQLHLEQLVAELSGTFINLPADKVEGQIIEALGRVAKLLEFDVVALSLFMSPAPTGRVAHLWKAEGVPDIPSDLSERDFPWVAQELFSGRDVSVRKTDELPLEAAQDKSTYERYHVRSTHNVPIVLGGTVIGVLGLCSVRKERGMSQEVLQTQRLLGEIFGNALARQKAEESLRESEDRFRSMANTAPVMVWMSATDKLCTFFNKGWLGFTGRSLEQELGNGWTEGVHEEDFDRCLEVYTKAFDARQEFTMEYRLRRHDGEYRWIFDNGVARFESDGTFVGYIGSCIDISERKRAEEKFRFAVEASPSGIVMINPQGEIVLVNRLTEKLFGYSREELIGQSVEMLVPDRFRADHPTYRKAFFVAPQSRAMGGGRDLFARRKDGSEFQVEIGLNPIETNEGTLVLTAIIDITERKLAEKNLMSALEEIRGLKERLEEENLYLKEEISEVKGFEQIVGKSDVLKYVLTRVEQVARTGATVLLQGETGVGKELIARAVHEKSSRCNGSYIKVNCATLPETLVESELFGHEKGAFTGADRQRKGRFELADGGTILLDEIGELPAGTQAKLLRVLQEGEFERVGGSDTIKVNVRVIAATNRKLHEEVSAGRFRQDLFYRINVYPITIPSLRQRPEDIPLLISHFARQIGERLGKNISEVPAQVLRQFTEYTWPGNIRELQNVIERAVIVSVDGVLRLPEPLVQTTRRPAEEKPAANDSTIVSSMDQAEREHILRALEATGWRINGPSGAAAMLKLHPSTLRFRIKKLGLTKVSGYTSAPKSNLQ